MEALDPRIRQQMLTLVRAKGKKHLRPWHGAPDVARVLVGVNSPIAVWHPYPGANANRDLALHVAYFENIVANRLSGVDAPVEFDLAKRGWAVTCDALDESQWRSERRFMQATTVRLAEAVRSFDPRRLDQPVSEKTGMTAMELIHGIVDHTLYHTAELRLLKTLANGLWRGSRKLISSSEGPSRSHAYDNSHSEKGKLSSQTRLRA